MKPEAQKTDRDRLIRTFLAIPLDRATLSRIESIQKRLQPTLPEIRWTDRNNLHLTLHFFGDITEESLEKSAKIMVSVGSLFIPFTLTLTEIGAFPSTDRARVVWIGVKSAKLGELHHALQTKLRAAGTPIECRPFRPHITIGRSRQRPGRILSQQQTIVTDNMRVDRLVLYESRLQPTGAEHHPRHTVRLTEP
jgi:2'-5' RNA ligase